MSGGRYDGRSEAVGVGDSSEQGLCLPLNFLEVQSKFYIYIKYIYTYSWKHERNFKNT